jgi:hypothetical protein
MTEYRKTVAAVVGAVVTILVAGGLIDGLDAQVQAAITTLLTAVAVYALPNKKAPSLIDDRPYEGTD